MQSDTHVRGGGRAIRFRDRLTSSLRKGKLPAAQPCETNTSTPTQDENIRLQRHTSTHGNVVQSVKQSTDASQPPSGDEGSLWCKAYAAKKADCPELIQGYQAIITKELQPSDESSPLMLERLVDQQTQKLEALRWKVQLAERPLVFKEQYAKDFVGPIANANPYAGFAWAGICVFLPLLCGPVEQDKALTEGLDDVCSVLYRFAVIERLYVEASKEPAFTQSLELEQFRTHFERIAVKTLSGVIEFQARVACYCDWTVAKRYINDAFRTNDWSQLSRQVKDDYNRFQRYIETVQMEDFEHRLDAQARRLQLISTNVDDMLGLTKKTLPMIRTELSRLDERLTAGQKHKCLESLWTSNYENHKRVIGEAVPGTCGWFTNHDQYKAWKEQMSDAVLWLSADPGCSKTVLVRHLVDQDLLSTKATVCYFFFRAGNTEQTRLEYALSAQLHQLLTQQPQLIQHALPRYEARGKALSGSVKDLWSIISDACRDSSAHEVVLIFDALDECDRNDCRDLIRMVTSTFASSTLDRRKSRFKVLLTSRPYHNINKEFQTLLSSLPTIHLSADREAESITKEINLVIDHRMAQISRDLALTEETTSALIVKLKGVGNRTYLWLTLILEVIEDRLETSKKRLAKLVDQLPSTIHEAYQSILSRSIDFGKARKIFSVLLAGQRPFTLSEMGKIVDLDESTAEEDDIEVDSDAVFREKIRYICGLFVVVVEDKIFFLHETVREFLISTEYQDMGSQLQRKFPLPLSFEESNLTLLNVCCWIVQHESRRTKERDHCSWLLLSYAATYWHTHYRRGWRPMSLKGGRHDGGIFMDTLAETGDVSEHHPLNALAGESALQLCSLIGVWWLYRKNRHLQTDPIYWPVSVTLACLGLDRLLDYYLSRTRDLDEIDKMDCRGRTALSWACSLGRVKVVKVLLHHNATVDCYVVPGRSPASLASSSEIQSLVASHTSKTLLTESQRCHEVLQWALSKPDCVLVDELRTPHSVDTAFSNDELTRVQTQYPSDFRLLLHGQRPYAMPSRAPSYQRMMEQIKAADAETLSVRAVEEDMTVLCVSASERRADVLKVFLDRGVDVNHRGQLTGKDALSFAAETGCPLCIRLLLERGADARCVDVRSRSALAYAMSSHNEDKATAIRMLLEAEGDIDVAIRRLTNMLATHDNRIGPDEENLENHLRDGMRMHRLNEDGTRTWIRLRPSTHKD